MRHLVVLGCSATKFDTPGVLPAIDRYDGPAYRVLRAYLRGAQWPDTLSVAVLSAEYGLIGGLAPIEHYDRRMNESRARDLAPTCQQTLEDWSAGHSKISYVLGRDYLPAVQQARVRARVVEGPIGMKLHHLSNLLDQMPRTARSAVETPVPDRPLYFLPDWDDMLDVDYDFQRDRFSSPDRRGRNEKHCVEVMKPQRLCDGILVSLAQHLGSKGSLRRFDATAPETLAPRQIRHTFGLAPDQLAFGDCGAFSYSNEDVPAITTEQALSLYQLYGFDFGASVDHIPLPVIERNGKPRTLSEAERAKRVKLTRDNAADFLDLYGERRCRFIPVGVLQGLTPDDYASQVAGYYEMGYRHIAIGGLVPQSDKAILEVVRAVARERDKLRRRLWLHLFGIFRPKIQADLWALGISSFDSATYFRKAWLRSSQNYLSRDGQWYAAIRVPVSGDPRTLKRLRARGLSARTLRKLELQALADLRGYARGKRSLDTTLKSVLAYDRCLSRSEADEVDLAMEYRKTLEARPWESCDCQVCTTAGIHVLIFRGYNRNKRRGAHNTLMLYRSRGLRTPGNGTS